MIKCLTVPLKLRDNHWRRCFDFLNSNFQNMNSEYKKTPGTKKQKYVQDIRSKDKSVFALNRTASKSLDTNTVVFNCSCI